MYTTTGSTNPNAFMYYHTPFWITNYPDRVLYEEELAQRQAQHLGNINNTQQWQPCLHDQCTQCHGTGVRLNGSPCVHSLSCSCSKCSPSY